MSLIRRSFSIPESEPARILDHEQNIQCDQIMGPVRNIGVEQEYVEFIDEFDAGSRHLLIGQT
jgi:hypothetical protein